MQKPIEYYKIKHFYELQIGLIKEGRKLNSTLEKNDDIVNNFKYLVSIWNYLKCVTVLYGHDTLKWDIVDKLLAKDTFYPRPIKEFADIIKNTPNPNQFPLVIFHWSYILFQLPIIIP